MFMWFPCGICFGRSCVKKVMCFFPGPESYEMRHSDWPNEWSEKQKVRNMDLEEFYKLHKMWKYRQTKENIKKLFTKHIRPYWENIALSHRIDSQPEVRLRHFLSHFFHARHFTRKRFWFYEFLFVEIWAITKNSDSSSTFQSEQRTFFLHKNDINIFSIT